MQEQQKKWDDFFKNNTATGNKRNNIDIPNNTQNHTENNVRRTFKDLVKEKGANEVDRIELQKALMEDYSKVRTEVFTDKIKSYKNMHETIKNALMNENSILIHTGDDLVCDKLLENASKDLGWELKTIYDDLKLGDELIKNANGGAYTYTNIRSIAGQKIVKMCQNSEEMPKLLTEQELLEFCRQCKPSITEETAQGLKKMA